MKKEIKHVITAIFAIGIFGLIEPSAYLNLNTTKAYAATNVRLDNLYLSDGYNIDFSEDKHSYIIDVDKSIDEIMLRAKPKDSDDKVKINDELIPNEDNYRKILKLEDGKNKFEIEVRDDNSATINVYTIYIYRGGKDALYLSDITMDSSNIGFEKTRSSYNIEVDEDTSKVLINAITEDENYKVSVNGTELEPPNLINIRFSGIGKYVIKVNITDIETKRSKDYVLNMYVGIPISPDISNSVDSVIKPNQWLVVNGRWRYNDSSGQCLKDRWFYDKKYDRLFHFNKRGNMQTGWIVVDNKWYYLAEHGAMQTGWILENDEWYFLDANGVMQTDWIFNNGKWYYLDSVGVMQTGWILYKGDWYVLDSSGAMVNGWAVYKGKRYFLNSCGVMETGWLYDKGDWYYLNGDGTMKSGEWVYSKGDWYYINYAGNMRTGWLYQNDKYYYLNEDGTMRTSTEIIDGYNYNFNNDGSVNLA